MLQTHQRFPHPHVSPRLDEISVSKTTKRIRRSSTHTGTTRMSALTGSERWIEASTRRCLRVETGSSLTLPCKERVVKGRMHAAAAHRAPKSRAYTSMERIMRPEALRVEVSVSDATKAALWHASRWTLDSVLVFETWDRFGDLTSWVAGMRERVLERIWTSRRITFFS